MITPRTQQIVKPAPASAGGWCKTELITDRVWRTRAQVELAIVEYVGWFNHARLHESLGDLPPAEFEALSAIPNDNQAGGRTNGGAPDDASV